MNKFELYYGPVPFQGQFVRGILAYCRISWSEYAVNAIEEIMTLGPGDQPVAFRVEPPQFNGRFYAFGQFEARSSSWLSQCLIKSGLQTAPGMPSRHLGVRGFHSLPDT